ncbi:SET domain-containing protein-lysine N-methyltransferase [Pedobacter sp. WC2501]|uniref:SET domain-containing protein-lysine N-methyltransferase n=1 Tax=Pedobacter sp. WC2501 TaxID=3461400 RepID=UPI0040465DAE
MLLVATFLEKSPSRGIGLFAKNFIPKDTVYWKRNDRFDRIFDIDQMAKFDQLVQDYVMYHGFLEINGSWYLCGDNARFTNHSDNPNTKNHFDSQGIVQFSTTSVDIQIGEEIFIDYTDTCQTCSEGVSFQSYF